MATDGQRSAFRRVDRLLAADSTIMADLDTELDEAQGALNLDPLDPSQWDRAVALLAAHRIRCSLPDQVLAGGTLASVADSPGGARSFDKVEAPAGYLADWYTTRYGLALIGLYASSSAHLPIAL
jgi:acyl-coenzyme A thioesterase PaaI-like protein